MLPTSTATPAHARAASRPVAPAPPAPEPAPNAPAPAPLDPATDDDDPRSDEPCGWSGPLPEPIADPLIGRASDLASLRALCTPGGPRLITLIGVGGVGKTRLASAAAHEARSVFGERIVWLELDHVGEPALLASVIAGAFTVGEERGQDTFARIGEAVGDRPALLVLDTLEHLAAGAGELARLIDATPALTVLATSRVPLGVAGERTFSVEPLHAPASHETDDLERLLANPAVELLVTRVRAVRPDAPMSPAIAVAYAAICRRLDGIPLAIELAAAALRVIEPHQLLDRLGDTIGRLETGDAAQPARRRSLRATMDWTHELLSEPLARLVRRLGVLASPFDVATAEAILAGGERRGLSRLGLPVAEGLAQLNDAYLLRRTEDGASVRFEMLRTVRADARERLEKSGEHVAMRWSHAYHHLELAEASERDLPTEREPEALERLERSHDDLADALDWAIAQGDGEFAVRLAGALAEFWRTRGHLTEGRIRLQAALAWGGDASPARRQKALAGAGLLASYQGDYPLGRSMLTEALALARTAGDEEGIATILNWLGTNAYGAGELDEAERHIAEGLSRRRALGDPGAIATSLNALGGIHHFRGELDRALDVFEESLALKQAQGNANGIAVSLTNIGLVERDAGHPERAASIFDEAIAIWTRTGDRQRIAVGLHNAALVDLDTGDHDRAVDRLERVIAEARLLGDRTETAYALADLARVRVARRELEQAERDVSSALRIAWALGSRVILPLALEAAGSLAAARGQAERAVRLWAAAQADRTRSGFVNQPADERLLARARAAIRAGAGEEAWTAWWRAGEALELEAAVQEAQRPAS